MRPTNNGKNREIGHKFIMIWTISIFVLLIAETAVIYFHIRKLVAAGIEKGLENGWIVSSGAAREGMLIPVLEGGGYVIFGAATVFLALALLILFLFNARVVRPYRQLMENRVEKRQIALKKATESLARETEEARRIEKELSEWREYFEGLFQNSTDAVLLADRAGKITKASKSSEETFGCLAGEMPGMSIFDLCGEKRDFEDLLALAGKEPVKHHEITMRKSDGTVFPSEISLTVFKDADSQITGSMAAVRDTSDVMSTIVELGSALAKLKSEIEERKKVDIELAKAKDYLENVFENSADVIIVVDKYSRIVNWNKMATEFFGYSFGELKGKSTFELYSDKEELEELLSVLREHDTVKRYEITMTKKDGTVCPIEASISMLRDENKKLIGSVGVIRDLSEIKKAMNETANANEKLKAEITERMRVEEELKKARDHLENVIESSADAIGIVDQDGRFFKWNRAAAKTFGYTFEEARQLPLRALYAESADYTRMRNILRKHGAISRYEIAMMTKDERELPIEMSIARLTDQKGKAIGSVCAARDLSDLKKALMETEKARYAAEEANQKILQSLKYAKTIQRSLLPNTEYVNRFLPDSFFLWRPRDLVGGDFYHVEVFDEGFFIAVFDCTGHGVPGAFMTMIASSGLRRIIGTEGCRDPAEILNRLNYTIKTTLQQDTAGRVLSDDGLDAAICFVKRDDSDRFILQYAGAQIPLYYVKNGEVKTIRGDKRSIGYKRSKLNYRFANHTVEADRETTFYMASDGFIQQLGGPRERSFGSTGFVNLLGACSKKPMAEQSEILIRAYDEYRGDYERLDDVTIIGFRLVNFS